MPSDPLTVSLDLGAALEKAGFDYAIGGALALGFWAVPRATLDVDVGVDADALRLPDLLTTLRQAGCSVDFGRALEAAQRGDFGVRKDGIRVDVFLPEFEVARSALDRRVSVDVAGRRLWIVSPEDLALLKLIFGRTKDFADLERLFSARAKSLDMKYLERSVGELFSPGDPRRTKFDELSRELAKQRARGE